MPPVRTETLNSANELPYLIPSRGITFAPNIAAETYNDPPELIVPPESTLFPSSNSSFNEVSTALRKSSHSKKRPDDWVPRPPNAFILFRSEFIKSQHVPGDVEANHGNLSKIIGLCWRNLPFSERDVWECKARIAMAEHKAKYPNYRFRPTHKDREPSHRRRVKEPPPPPDEQRCAEIANLLVCGMKGEVLANKVRELDAIRPQDKVRMRFDEPVTPSTNSFVTDKSSSLDKFEELPLQDEGEKESAKEKCCRSSSAPVPDVAATVGDGEDTKFIPHTPGRQSRRARTVSSTPSRNRAASSSPVKRTAHRSRGYSLRIETVKERESAHADEDVASRQIFVGVFRTNKDSKQERLPLPLPAPVKEVQADDPSHPQSSDETGLDDGCQAEEGEAAIIDHIGILSPPFTPASDAVFPNSVDTFSWTQAAAALELEQQSASWVPNTPPTSGQKTAPWTPHTPNFQNLYPESPLNSPNSNSPFMSAEQVYMPYATPLTPVERFAPVQYPPPSPFPPPTPISPEFAATVVPSIPSTATHAPIPRQPYIDIPNLTGDFYSDELLHEHAYNFAQEYGTGDLDAVAECYGDNPTGYDPNENHLMFSREVQDSSRVAVSDLQIYRPSAVLINTHHTHQIMGLCVDSNPIELNLKRRPPGDDTGARPLIVAY